LHKTANLGRPHQSKRIRKFPLLVVFDRTTLSPQYSLMLKRRPREIALTDRSPLCSAVFDDWRDAKENWVATSDLHRAVCGGGGGGDGRRDETSGALPERFSAGDSDKGGCIQCKRPKSIGIPPPKIRSSGKNASK
jgi:hypothetical protein